MICIFNRGQYLYEDNRPTADNLVPIRLDIEIDGQRFKDAFTWNPSGISYPPLSSSFLIALSIFWFFHFVGNIQISKKIPISLKFNIVKQGSLI